MSGVPADRTSARPRSGHDLGIYDSRGFVIRATVEFVTGALAAEALAAVLLPATSLRRVESSLRASGVDVEAARRDGGYLEFEAEEIIERLMATGAVDVERFGETTEQLFEAARERGRELRICADLHSELWRRGDLQLALDHERLWNAVPPEIEFDLLCLYAAHIFHDGNGDDPFLELCEQHTLVEPVENYASLVDPAYEQRSLALLEEQRRANQRDRRELASRLAEVEAALDEAISWAEQQRGQFEEAVASRDVIGQAKGIIMVRWHIDATTAFEMLRDASSRSHRKLRDVAQAVVHQQLRRN